MIKTFCIAQSAGKIMLTLFWDMKGVILEYFMAKRDNCKLYFSLQLNEYPFEASCLHQMSMLSAGGLQGSPSQ
jgi:hypothetical protein